MSRSQWSLQLGSSPSCVEFPSHARQFCAKTCLFKPPKICFQSDVWWGNGKYLRLLFSFTLSPLQLGRIHVPRWHKMYDAPFFFSQIADVSDSAVTLSSSLSFIKGTALQNHLWWHTSNDNNSTSWGHWGTFNYGIKLGVHFHVYFWAKIWGKSFFFPLVTAWSITDHWNPWIDKCTHHLWSHRYHQRTFHVFLMLIHDPRLLFVKAMESQIGR